jgi:predicted outer membrane repeat protein
MMNKTKIISFVLAVFILLGLGALFVQPQILKGSLPFEDPSRIVRCSDGEFYLSPAFRLLVDLDETRSEAYVRHSISEAITESLSGDRVVVCPGVYEESAYVEPSKRILLYGLGDDPEQVVMDGVNEYQLIYLDGNSELLVENMSFQNGFSPSVGGAIELHVGSELELTNVLIKDNHAIANGGGIYVSYQARLFMENVDFIGNYTRSSGGAIRFSDETEGELRNVKMHRNTAEGNGGAISSHAGRLIIEGADFQDNHAVGSGGVIDSIVGYVFIDGGTLSGNIAGVRGSIVSTSSRTLFVDINDVDITNNFKNLFSIKGLGLSLNNTEISNNIVDDTNLLDLQYTGSDLAVMNQMHMNSVNVFGNEVNLSLFNIIEGSVFVSNSKFLKNKSEEANGAIFNVKSDASVEVDGTTFKGNTALNGEGGVFYLEIFTNLILKNSIFMNNSAGPPSDGIAGAISAMLGGPVSVDVSGTVFSNNELENCTGGPFTDLGENRDSDGTCF